MDHLIYESARSILGRTTSIAPDRTWVEFPRSEHLHSARYNPGNEILEIRFRDGSIYKYQNISVRLWRGLNRAVSKGSYFHHYIASKPFTKLQ